MKVFVLNNKDILDIIQMSTESSEHRTLLQDLNHSSGTPMTGYMYNVLSMYLLNYVPLNDTMLSVCQHNEIYTAFSGVASLLDNCTMDIMTVDHIESIMGSGLVDYYGGFCATMYEDLYQSLQDYYVTLYGSRFISEHHESLSEDLERVADLTRFVAKEIESRYLCYREDEKISHVLFGMKQGRLVIVVE